MKKFVNFTSYMYLVYFMSFFSLESWAQLEVSEVFLNKEETALLIVGPVEDFRLIEVLIEAPESVKTLVLHVSGGRGDLAIELAEIVRARQWVTYVPYSCISACTMIFQGGEERVAAPTALFEFHYIRWYENGRPNQLHPKRKGIQEVFTNAYIRLGMDPILAYEISRLDFSARSYDPKIRSVVQRVESLIFGFELGSNKIYEQLNDNL